MGTRVPISIIFGIPTTLQLSKITYEILKGVSAIIAKKRHEFAIIEFRSKSA